MEAQSEHVHVAYTFLARLAQICTLSRCLVAKISASELRRKLVKSALLVGHPRASSSYTQDQPVVADLVQYALLPVVPGEGPHGAVPVHLGGGVPGQEGGEDRKKKKEKSCESITGSCFSFSCESFRMLTGSCFSFSCESFRMLTWLFFFFFCSCELLRMFTGSTCFYLFL